MHIQFSPTCSFLSYLPSCNAFLKHWFLLIYDFLCTHMSNICFIVSLLWLWGANVEGFQFANWFANRNFGRFALRYKPNLISPLSPNPTFRKIHMPNTFCAFSLTDLKHWCMQHYSLKNRGFSLKRYWEIPCYLLGKPRFPHGECLVWFMLWLNDKS